MARPPGSRAQNDGEMAVANSLAAVAAGVVHVQGTINGLGERCGNANLISVIANLKLKLGVDCVTDEQLRHLKEVAIFVSERANRAPDPFQPFVGARGVSHKGGVPAAAGAPMAGWRAKAKSSTVAPVGKVSGSPLGVNSCRVSICAWRNTSSIRRSSVSE